MFASHLFAVVSAPKMQQKGEKKSEQLQIVAKSS